MPSIILDRKNNAIPPTGYQIIDTEVAFLENAISGVSLFIRGNRLCTWAKEFYDGRKISYKDAISPVSDLMETFAGLTIEQANFICERLGHSLPRLEKLSAAEILSACYPIHLWASIPSKKHAAEWLLWLDVTELDDAFQPILRVITTDWKQMASELEVIYDVQTQPAAREILAKWLGAKITPFIEKYGEFPLPVPDKWIALLNQSWRTEIVKSDGTFISDFLYTSTPWQFKQKVAQASLEYFEKYPDMLTFTPERYNQISRFVSGNDRIRLSCIKFVPPPDDVPDAVESVLAWFSKQYLPYREWHNATKPGSKDPRALELGRQFANWYLDFYPKALTSKKHISFFKSKSLKEQDSTHVDLLVILDGLHALDAKFVMDALLKTNGIQHLEMIENSYCFAPLPTVTDFAKGALIHGAQPTLMKDFESLGDVISEQHTPLQKLQVAPLGSLLIWRIQEPDRAYHIKNRSETLKAEVEGELSKIVQKILNVVENLSSTIPLRITITTDHGRLLGVAKRTVAIPHGMQAHGRAAWGQIEISFDKTGYKIDGDLVYLARERFGLMSDHAAVILSDCAFEHDTYDQEISPHGGLYPEEVIIPWMVFERNIAKPDLIVKITGDGRANMPGKAAVSIINPSVIDLILFHIELNFGGEKNIPFNLQKDIIGFKKTEFEIDIPDWPSSEQVSLGKALAFLRLPSGEEFSIPLSLDAIEVTELYTRDKSLLEGLEL